MKKVVELLKKNGLTISTMESCTGGGVVNAITNVEGASEVIKFSAITYSNEFKIKMGVSKDIIDKYSVYSMETAREMALNITKFTNSDIGIGITGKLNRIDENNLVGDNNKVFISILDTRNNKYNDKEIIVENTSREDNKQMIINSVKEMLIKILEEEK